MNLPRIILNTGLGLGLIFGLALGAGGLACQKRGPVASGDTYVESLNWANIYFDFDKYDLKPAAQSTLSRHAAEMRANPQLNIVVEGHCDEWGTEEYNLALGERRANAAKSYLVNLGISPDRIYTISFGELRPVDPGHNPAAWQQNRRDEFKRRR